MSSSLPPSPIDPLMYEMASSLPQVFTCTATQLILQAWEPSLIGQWPSTGLACRSRGWDYRLVRVQDWLSCDL